MDPILETLELVKKLISIDSTSQRSNVEITDYVQGILEESRFEVERLSYLDTFDIELNPITLKSKTGRTIDSFQGSITRNEKVWQRRRRYDVDLLGRLVHGLYGFLHERFWQIPAANRYTSAEYRRRLTATGFSAIQLEDVTDRVIVPYGDSGRALFPPSSHFKRFWAKPILWEARKFFRSGYFQYILAAAQKPESVLLD